MVEFCNYIYRMNLVKLLPSCFLIVLVFVTSLMKLGVEDQHQVLASVHSSDKIESVSKKEPHFLSAISNQFQLTIEQNTGEHISHYPTIIEHAIIGWRKPCEISLKPWASAISCVLTTSLKQLLYPFHFFW